MGRTKQHTSTQTTPKPRKTTNSAEAKSTTSDSSSTTETQHKPYAFEMFTEEYFLQQCCDEIEHMKLAYTVALVYTKEMIEHIYDTDFKHQYALVRLQESLDHTSERLYARL